jgi:hypothetical protein
MDLTADEMDKLVYEIVSGYEGVRDERKPPLMRDEIYESVLGHLTQNIAQYVLPSLQRLAENGAIVEDRDVSRGRPYRYWMPKN